MYSVVYLSIRHAVSELRGELGGKRSLFQVAGRHGNPVYTQTDILSFDWISEDLKTSL